MTETNSGNNSDWIRLNIFQTTKDTLSRHPDTFLARLVNGELPSDKDESGAYLVDGCPEHFDTIMTYLRRGVLNLDGNKNTAKDLLVEADFYKIQPLVDEIQKALNSKWVRLNVGGKIFQTTKDTFSQYPESFLARLVNGELSSDKDDTGAILIDRDYEHFGTILNYFRSGVVNLDRNEKAMKDLSVEADFYNIQPLVDEIQKALRSVDSNNVRLNVGGKIFQTTKDTLSRYPKSLLARLVNGELSCDKDESGAYFFDRDPEQFGTIMTYLRKGVLKLDGNENTAKDLLCEADFYKIQPLVDEIRKALRAVKKEAVVSGRLEVVVVGMKSGKVSIGGQNVSYIGCLEMSDQSEDNEVLQALRQKVEIRTVNENGFYKHYLTSADGVTWNWITIEPTLHGIGFVKDNVPDDLCSKKYKAYSKFTRIVRQ